MNKKKRMSIKDAVSMIEAAFQIVEYVKDDEQECLYNMPENLESSERYEKMENALDKLEDAAQGIRDVIDLLVEASE